MFTLILLAVLFAPTANPIAPSADLVQEFRQRDQALLDAFAPGDVKVWDAALAADAVYVDENGTVMNRADFLKQLMPLPAGVSGTIAISAYSAHETGDVVTVIHTDDEDEFYHGQHLQAQYLTTEIWRREDGAWKLLLVHANSVLKEPKSVDLSMDALNAYAGRYSAGPDLAYTIRREGDHLVGEREGRSATALKAEVRDVFFVSGQLRTRKIFERDHSGSVTGFVDRREGSDLVWKRVL
jgi:ketosteroid isomerase-like protein